MNKTLSTTVSVIAILALAAVIFFAGSMYVRANTFGPAMVFGWNNGNIYGTNGMMGNWRGPSMMQGYGRNNGNGFGGHIFLYPWHGTFIEESAVQ